jgi:hypothetical protein
VQYPAGSAIVLEVNAGGNFDVDVMNAAPPFSAPIQRTTNPAFDGTPDFNGVGANSVGSVLFTSRLAAPEDLLIDVSETDVRAQVRLPQSGTRLRQFHLRQSHPDWLRAGRPTAEPGCPD